MTKKEWISTTPVMPILLESKRLKINNHLWRNKSTPVTCRNANYIFDQHKETEGVLRGCEEFKQKSSSYNNKEPTTSILGNR